MGVARRGEPSELRAISDALATFTPHRPNGTNVFDAVLPAIRRLLDVESVVLYTPAQGLDSLELERYHVDGFDDPAAVYQRFMALFAKTKRAFFYDPLSPEHAQRNRVVEATLLVRPDEFEASAIYREVLRPSGYHRHLQPRILMCEGPVLLGWFGSFHPERVTARVQRLLARLAAPVRRRASLERRLRVDARNAAALHVALEYVGSPAFIISARDASLEANTSGRALVDGDPAVRQSLRDAIAGRPAAHRFEVISLRDRGVPDAWLAILRDLTPEQRTRARLDKLHGRWNLTPRQRDVLALSVDGHAVATIAQLLNLGVRAVELHLTALFDKAGVDGRAALVAKVLQYTD